MCEKCQKKLALKQALLEAASIKDTEPVMEDPATNEQGEVKERSSSSNK